MVNSRYDALLKGAEVIINTAAEQLKDAALNTVEAIKGPPPTKEALQKGANLIKLTLLNTEKEKQQQQGQVPVRHGKQDGQQR